jgi:hypothetical protein
MSLTRISRHVRAPDQVMLMDGLRLQLAALIVDEFTDDRES